METVLIGEVSRAHGLNGELKIKPISQDPKRYKDLREIILCPQNGIPQRYVVEKIQVQSNFFCLKLAGIVDRDKAETFRGFEVRIDRKDVPPLTEGWYYFELEGLKVYENESYLGILEQVLQTGANDVYLVCGPRGEICVPALKTVVKEVDLEQGIMKVVLMPGLIEDDQ